MDLVRRTAVKLHIARQRDHIGTRLFQRLADIKRFEFGQGIDVFQHLLPDPCKDAAAFEIRELPPVGCQRRLGGLNGCVDILRVAFGDGAQRVAIRRVAQIKGFTALRWYPAPPDKTLCRVDPKGAKGHGQSF